MASINTRYVVTLTDTAFPSLPRQLTWSKTHTWTDGDVVAEWYQSIGTTSGGDAINATFLGLGEAGGRLIIQNLDTTNYVELGRNVSGAFYDTNRILPQDCLPTTLSTSFASLYLKANSSAVKVRILITKA